MKDEIEPEDGVTDAQYRMLRIAMSRDAFYRLPPNGAYRYEYAHGNVEITARPECCDLFLELDSFVAPGPRLYERGRVRPMGEGDWDDLADLAGAAFFRVAPFATVGEEDIGRVMAAELRRTRGGRDGALIEDACRVAETPWGAEGTLHKTGAAIVTLRKGETNGGAMVPLLTWIFVSPMSRRGGVAAALLADVVRVLKGKGHGRLESVVCTGNHRSMAWHWRMGFKMGASYHEKVRERLDAEARDRPSG